MGHGRFPWRRARRALCQAICICCALALAHVAVASADTPTEIGTPTPTPQENASTPTPATATPETPATPAATATPEATATPASLAQGPSAQQATATPTPEAPGAPTLAPSEPATTPTPAAPTPAVPTPVTPTPLEPTAAPPLTGTAHLAIQVSDCVVSVGGTASSEVFVYLQDVQPGIDGFHLSLHFDPQIVQIVDADGNAANGTQVAPAAFLSESQRVAENRVDNGTGQVSLTVTQGGGAPLHGTSSWLKVAVLTWSGQKKGNSVIAVGGASHFTAPDGRQFAPDAAHNGTVFARAPGQITGVVRLQGREANGSAVVTSSLAASRIDQARTGPDGRFELTTSHGEGFYTLVASAPGYLSAESHRPIKLTVGSVIDLGEVTLLGGDATGDNRIDIRDLSLVAWHLRTSDATADINGDGQVDILDLSLIAGNFGQVGPTVWQVPGGQ